MTAVKATRQALEKGIRLSIGPALIVKVIRSVRRVRLTGMFFDLNKCFLLPSAMPGIKAIKRKYDEHPKSNLLVVGHTDTSGNPDPNLTLSLERADAMAAYLTDQTAPWEAFFDAGKPDTKRWGIREVQLMLSALPDGGAPFFSGEATGKEDAATTEAVKGFQSANGLKVDGIAGPKTRKALIQSYMAIDGTSLPQGTTLTTHGCGENFPVEETGDNVRDPDNRRVEIFFFDGPVTPPPPSKTSRKNSKEYPKWLDQVEETTDVTTGIVVADALRLRVHADPRIALDLKDKFRLFNDQGFEQILDMAKDAEEDADFVDLLYKNVPVDAGYSLEVVREEDGNYLLLDNVPFAAIESTAEDPRPDPEDPLELEPGTEA
jgi:outer membrane protein OmpA-like peptidoglycan-associated protein